MVKRKNEVFEKEIKGKRRGEQGRNEGRAERGKDGVSE